MIKKILTLFVVLFATMLVACSEDDSPKMQGEINKSHISSLSRDGSVSTYVKIGLKVYRNYGETDADWETYDVKGLDGWMSDFDETISFQDGKVWRPVTMFLGYGFVPVDDVWRAYSKVTGEARELYISSRFEFDEQNNTISFNGEKYGVIEFTEKELILSHDVNLIGGGVEREIATFKKGTPVHFDGSKILQFESDYECYLYIAKKGREQFGRYINLNEVFKGWVILDDPIVDMDEIDAWLEEYKKELNL